MMRYVQFRMYSKWYLIPVHNPRVELVAKVPWSPLCLPYPVTGESRWRACIYAGGFNDDSRYISWSGVVKNSRWRRPPRGYRCRISMYLLTSSCPYFKARDLSFGHLGHFLIVKDSIMAFAILYSVLKFVAGMKGALLGGVLERSASVHW